MVRITRPFRFILLVVLSSLILACGGGGGGSSSDTTPDSFTLEAVTDQERDADISSNEITISGIDAAATVTITGGEYSVNGGAFTSANSTVSDGQRIVVQGRSSSDFDTETTVTLSVGGVSGNFVITTIARDDSPETFAGAQTDALISANINFEFDVTGINDTVDATIEGGLFSVEGGELSSTAKQISNGDSVVVQVSASGEFSTTINATLTIGSVEGVFSVTTEAEDTEPNAFELGDTETVNEPSVYAESDSITVSGINSPAAISIENGEFRVIGETEYGDTQPATVTVGQQVQVRVQASASHDQTVTSTLTIDTQNDTFSVTTADASAPTVNVLFPTPSTMSDGTTVTLRGDATDDFGPVESIQVVVLNGETEVDNEVINVGDSEDFQDTWSVQVNLATDVVNTLQVTATDSAGNVQSSPTVISIAQTTTPDATAFPLGDTSVLFTNNRLYGIALDREGNRNRILMPTREDQILAIEVSDGSRSILVESSPDFRSFSSLLVLAGGEQFVFGDQTGSVIYRANIDGTNVQVLTDNNTPDSDVVMDAPYGMAQDSLGELYAVDVVGQLYTIDLITGARTLVSNGNRPVGGENSFNQPVSLMLNDEETSALVAQYLGGQLLWVNLDTGARTVFVDNDVLTNPFDIVYDADDSRAIVVDQGLQEILAVNIETSAVSTISSDGVPNNSNDLYDPYGIAIDEAADIAFVLSDQGSAGPWSSIKVIDLNSGERVTLTNPVCPEC